ncbi:hypothetical protein B0H15DRAFT_944981 [Mycena belliarum]|uniref:Uncharacterized protein n=1 Tax=Mycena belliarum TaxID=1033014 RepID=A0AAD6XS98_9AGAR|nr:hypothetical protein B0H15DRAFT_944981 [Mycena belliae]
MNAQPSDIPDRLLASFPDGPELLMPRVNEVLLDDCDFPKKAVLYHPGEHYLGWAPSAALYGTPLGGAYNDPLEFLFSVEDVDVHSTSTWVYGEDSDDPAGESRVFAGYYVDSEWAAHATSLAEKLHGLCSKLADGSVWYRRSFWTGARGDLPPKYDGSLLGAPHLTHRDALTEVDYAKRSILGTLGYLAWYLSVAELGGKLDPAEDEYLRSLRLLERPKAGVIYDLGRDFHEANFLHLAWNEVPVHYRWTDVEESDGRFRRLSPSYWAEYCSLRESTDGDDEVRIEDFPSYAKWRGDLERYDWFFQDLRAGKRGKEINPRSFKPGWEYRIIDFRLWGARTVTHWETIRAYSEKFKGSIAQTPYGTVCTFFRQNPRSPQEPAMLRERPEGHANELTDFATAEIGPAEGEDEVFYESTVRVREMAKNKWAPRPGRTFNSFDGRLDSVGTTTGARKKRRTARGEAAPSEPSSSYGEVRSHSSLMERLGPVHAPGFTPPRPALSDTTSEVALTSEWARAIASGSRAHTNVRQGVVSISSGSSKRQRAESPDSCEGPSVAGESFAEEFAEAERAREVIEGHPTGSAIPYQQDVRMAGPWTERASPRESPDVEVIPDRATAVLQVEQWARKVTEVTPSIGGYAGLFWDLTWLSVAVLVCDDERSALRMKAYAACTPGVESITDVMEIAIRFGLPFEIYIPTSRARDFARGRPVGALDQDTLDALYAPGYRDTLLTFGGGGAVLYEQYRGLLNALLRRPHAIAFIYAGGVLRFIAEAYDRRLVHRLVEGPSLQVTEHMAGRTRLLRRGSKEEFFVTDRVSNSEVSLLLGHVAGTKATNDTWLWPPPEVMESESLYMRGYLSGGAYRILSNLRDDIMTKKKYIWRTRADWKEYFRNGQRGSFAPAVVPSKPDFDEGARLFERTFPIKWMNQNIVDIAIPEDFEPLARD